MLISRHASTAILISIVDAIQQYFISLFYHNNIIILKRKNKKLENSVKLEKMNKTSKYDRKVTLKLQK